MELRIHILNDLFLLEKSPQLIDLFEGIFVCLNKIFNGLWIYFKRIWRFYRPKLLSSHEHSLIR